MEVFNRLKNTVSSTVSQLSGVLPGNPVTREFEATHLIASAGPGLLWKVYSGYKRSTKQEAAIFVFEKKQIERWSRRDREIMVEVLKRGVSQLTRLRHPQILTVQHPMEESRESLAFATEPIFASLANALGCTSNLPAPLPPHLKDCKLFEVEIKYGLLQISEGLAFLHNDVKLLHRNMSPESIIINQQGAWKIFGFDFCVMNTASADQKPFWPFQEYDPELHPAAQPNLNYLAPEYALTLTNDPGSDMFSLGMLTYAIFNDGRPIFNNNGEWSSFKQNACELKQLSASNLQCVPDPLREYVKMLLSVTLEVRPDAHQFSKVSFFEDVGVKTLNYLDSLFQWDNLQKSKFYKGLPQIIPKLPHRVCLNRIIPCLVKEFVNPSMVPFVLPNVLLVAQDTPKESYVRLILPHLKPVMKIREPVQVLLIFMQRMELLLQKTPPEDVKTHVLPMLYQALESDAHQIQELCLSVIPNFASLIDYPAMKNALLPRIKKLCVCTGYLSVRVNCLLCLGKLLEHLDKWLVIDEVLPLLPQIPSREPAVLMGILGIYKLALTHKKLGISKELMATKVLPFLMPLSIENGLTLNQFNAIMALIKEMVQKVESEHRVKLQQLNSIQEEQKSAFQMNLDAPRRPDELVPAPEAASELDSMFSGLGLDAFMQKKSTSSIANDLLGESSPSSSAPSPESFNGTVKNSNSLTLEEKQRLAKDQESQQRLKVQSPLTPKQSEASPTKPHPKDLTSTLIASNLNQMKYSQASPSQGFSPQQPQPFRGNPYTFSPQQQIQSPPQIQLGLTAFGPRANQPKWNFPASNMTQQFPTPINQQQFSPNLMANPQNLMSPPQMMPIQQQQQNIKPLSTNDIKDLLS